MSPPVFAFACRLRDSEYESIYNARTPGQAKRRYLSVIREPVPDAVFTDIRARKVGEAHSSHDFLLVAAKRGLPGVRCGQAVEIVDDSGVRWATGAIVGCNDSANFDILFDDGPNAGLVLNVHPSDVRPLQAVPEPAS